MRLINKCFFILLFLLIFSCKKESNISEAITNEAKEMLVKTSRIRNKNVLYLYTEIVKKDTLVGIAYGLPLYEKDKYYLKMVGNKPLLIEKNIYNKYFENEKLEMYNNHEYFRSETYFPNIGEPYYVNIYIKNGKVKNIEKRNIPENE
ncbi:hypothetical protein RAH57_13635 [Chryseobacterium sp. CKR4-1]|uniref:hypothetical protein n=1 Tax=Chryseobacterium sp. CKR4-1 TaxID=3068896 RepID=UPI002796CCB4|nr:hypothetical protein [Chryseobacterium sp. CKR4-1]MDQ1805036.1 hypothetical protein [Chryseobacterium sp. CKR4-1]